MVDGLVHVFGFDLGEHVPVAVVVVADVVVVEIGQRSALVVRAEIFAILLGDHGLAVRIERRNEQHDDVIQAAERLGIVGGGELVRPLHGHLAGADFSE